MKRLKQKHIGSKVYIPRLGKQIEVTEENADSLRLHGQVDLFEDVPAKKATKVTTVKPKRAKKNDDPTS